MPLATWERVATAVGLDLAAILHTPFQEAAFAVQLRCHRLLVEHAAVGGWVGQTVVDPHDPSRTMTVLERAFRDEVAVAQVWDVIGSVDAAIETIRGRIEQERGKRGKAALVGGVVVIVSNGGNRRRLTESAVAVVAGIEVFGLDWWAALSAVGVPMPTRIGSIWTDAACTRLRPRIPYVDGRARHPSDAHAP